MKYLQRIEAVLARIEHFRFRMWLHFVADKKKRAFRQRDLSEQSDA
jgi:hypothetical protein